MKHDHKDFALRALIVVAGCLAAVVLTIKGFGEALPGVAIGGALGAFVVSLVQQQPARED
jgi:hypothetical protein